LLRCCRAAELLTSLPDPEPDTLDSSTADAHPTTEHFSPILSPNPDPEEARREARELNKYLLAKSLFDCREYDRCAAVFLPDSLLAGLVEAKPDALSGTHKGKGVARGTTAETTQGANGVTLPQLSQKSLFLALYAKIISGEKRKDEDTEMVMGPRDLGTVVNKQLLSVSRYLSAWFEERETSDGEAAGSQGWLEYLYVQPTRWSSQDG
jgi:anaphase-promoting complex subunit 8